MKSSQVFRGAAIVLGLATIAWSAPYSAMVTFGDSLSDTGNVYELFGGLYPPAPYYEGRFSNGPVWVEALASELSLPAPLPNMIGGTNNAWGGAETGGGLSDVFTPNVGIQISNYLSEAGLDGSELITLWAGGNDFLNGQGNAAIPANNIYEHISVLAQAGGHSFLVPNLPPLGQLPGTRGTADEAELDALAVSFNTQLAAKLEQLRSLFDITIFELDMYEFYENIFEDPGAYGFVNVTDAAYDEGSGDVVPNPDEYLFWDSIHPTATAHAMVGEYAAAMIPEPAGLVVLVAAAELINRRRRPAAA